MKNIFIQEKIILRLTFNPGSALTGLLRKKMIHAHFVELAQKLLIIYFMNVLTLASFKDFKMFWLALYDKRVEIFLQDVLIAGKLNEVSDIFNYFLVIAKWHICTGRKRSLSPDITVFKEMVNMNVRVKST